MILSVKKMSVPRFRILFLSDLHKGNRYTDESAHDAYLNMVDDNTRILLGGDLHEAKLRRNKGRLSDQIETPGNQLEYWQHKLRPYRLNIDGVCSGNHEETIIQEAEIDVTRQLVRYLDGDNEDLIKYDSHGVWVTYMYNLPGGHTTTISIDLKHGHSAAALPGGKLNAANRQRMNVSADIILTGHVHQFTQTPGQFYDVCLTGPHKTLRVKEQWTVTNGSCLEYGGYAEDANYQAQPIIQTMIYVDLSGLKPKYDIVPIRPNGHCWWDR